MTNSENHDLGAIFKDREKLLNAIKESVQNAVRTRKMLGLSVSTWRDGKVVIVPPEEINVPPSDSPPQLPIF